MRNPIPTVDIIMELFDGIVLIKRRNLPHGWAIPGGYVDYGESLEEAAIREAKEETNLDVTLVRQLYTYSDPHRDMRHHTLSTVFIGTASGIPREGSDADAAMVVQPPWPTPLVFDHETILADYLAWKIDPSYHPLKRSTRPL